MTTADSGLQYAVDISLGAAVNEFLTEVEALLDSRMLPDDVAVHADAIYGFAFDCRRKTGGWVDWVYLRELSDLIGGWL